MADTSMEEDLFADLYDDDDEPSAPVPATAQSERVEAAPVESELKPEPEPEPAFKDDSQAQQTQPTASAASDVNVKTEAGDGMDVAQDNIGGFHDDDYDRPIGIKEDGKMFIGGLNWETTDQSLKDYFSQFGEVVECTVMRDGATGRSRGFGFLTFQDPKTVNIVMVKEHSLDGKLIDPKRAIPREEQERTAKIFVGGVSQECTETQFKEHFSQYGRVLDATLMMDKDTGRPRGFGFVTYDSEVAVERALKGKNTFGGRPTEVKPAVSRTTISNDEGHGGKSGGRGGKGGNAFNNQQQPPMDDTSSNSNNYSQAKLGQYWQNVQQYYQMQQQMAAMMNGNSLNPMTMLNNPMMQQMMQQTMVQQGMNPQMMQQMMQQMAANMQGNGGGYTGMQNNGGSPMNGGASNAAFNAQDQLVFEQQKYERQQIARMQQGNFQGGNTWEGMYDDVPAPTGMQTAGTNVRGGFGAGRGNRGGRGSQGTTPQPVGQAPANAPTGPKNAGIPGANYRGGGRGGRRGFHPYARGGG